MLNKFWIPILIIKYIYSCCFLSLDESIHSWVLKLSVSPASLVAQCALTIFPHYDLINYLLGHHRILNFYSLHVISALVEMIAPIYSECYLCLATYLCRFLDICHKLFPSNVKYNSMYMILLSTQIHFPCFIVILKSLWFLSTSSRHVHNVLKPSLIKLCIGSIYLSWNYHFVAVTP